MSDLSLTPVAPENLTASVGVVDNRSRDAFIQETIRTRTVISNAETCAALRHKARRLQFQIYSIKFRLSFFKLCLKVANFALRLCDYPIRRA